MYFSCKERYCKISDDTPVPDIRPLGLLFAFRTDITNMAVFLFVMALKSINRSAHCTQVSDQCPLGLLFYFFIVVEDKNIFLMFYIPK